MHHRKRESLDEAVENLITAFISPREQIVDVVSEEEDNCVKYDVQLDDDSSVVVTAEFTYIGNCTKLTRIVFDDASTGEAPSLEELEDICSTLRYVDKPGMADKLVAWYSSTVSKP